MIELRRHAEGIVRPIFAHEVRKDRMRRELLGHLVASYEETIAAGAAHGAALDAAIGALGEPELLRNELQAAVPKWEAFGNAADPLGFEAAFRQLVDPANRRYAVPAARFAVSMVKFLMVICVFVVVMVCGVLALRMDEFSASRVALGLAAGLATSVMIASWLGVCVFAVNYLAARLRIVQCLHASSAAPGFVKAVVAYGLMAGYVVPFATGFMLMVEFVLGQERKAFEMQDFAAFALGHTWPYLFGGLVVLVVVAAYQFGQRHRHYLEWDSLEIKQ